MRIVGIIQARSSSVRCPGKMLRPLHGRPMIDWVIEAAQRAPGLDAVAVATSADPSDDALARHVAARGVALHRGPLDDVAGRMREAATALSCDAFVRINGDSPLLDSTLIARAVALFRQGGFDLVSNVVVRSFPKGQSVEVISRTAMENAYAQMRTAEEREHVTPYFYRHPQDFRIGSFTADEPMPKLQMSVDTEADFARCAAVIAACGGDVRGKGWRALAQLHLAEEAT
jgi:spore coat polysaccharide biosynthesis protein SpsF (cytidylyltransferase family)